MAVFVMAAALSACGGGSSGSPTPVLGASALPWCPADLSKLTSRIYVDSRSSAGDVCGPTTATACPEIQQGIVACGSSSGCGVVVRHGRYHTTATIVLRDGADVYGSCLFNADADAVGTASVAMLLNASAGIELQASLLASGKGGGFGAGPGGAVKRVRRRRLHPGVAWP